MYSQIETDRINIAYLVGFPGIEKNPLGRGSLAGIDMSNNSDVSDFV